MEIVSTSILFVTTGFPSLIFSRRFPHQMTEMSATDTLPVVQKGMPTNMVMINITMERSAIFHGKIHYFLLASFNSYFDITRGYQSLSILGDLQRNLEMNHDHWARPSCLRLFLLNSSFASDFLTK